MGTGQSKPGVARIAPITRQQLLESTKSSREFTNKLFNTMIKELTPEDILALGNPASCSKFIFLLANNFQKLFQSLRIKPKKENPSGIILFQHTKSLTSTPESKEICLEIAYFFIRIFQIFGALAITVLDDPGAGAVLGATQYVRPGLFPQFGGPKPLPRKLVPLTGGNGVRFFNDKKRVAGILGSLSPLDSILVESEKISGKRAFYFDTGNYNLIIFPEKHHNLRYKIDEETYIDTNMQMKPIVSGRGDYYEYAVVIKDAIYTGSDDPEIIKLINSRIKGIIDFKTRSADNKQTWTVKDENLSSYLENYAFKPILDRINEIRINPAKYKREAEQKRQDILPRGPVGVLSPFETQYIKETLQALATRKSVSFCVARALQLLDASSISPTPTSGVCAAKFEAAPFSVPQSGRRISDIPGLRAVDQLFYTQVKLAELKTAPNKIEPKFEAKVPEQDKVSGGEYVQFLKDISKLFGKDISKDPSEFSAIYSKDKQDGCSAIQQTLVLKDPRKIMEVRQIVGQLFAKQLAHTNQVMKFFRERLFLVKQQRDSMGQYTYAVDIHPNLLRGGIDEVNKMSKYVRQFLLKYYSDCETMYQEGVKKVLEASR